MSLVQLFKNRDKVLGMNKRNLYYIRKYNKLDAKEIADDKILTKSVLAKAGIPTPKLLAIINDLDELAKFDWNSLPNSFVMKPVSGLEGGGIEIFFNRNDKGNWIKADGSQMSVSDVKVLAYDICSGRFSLNQEPDRILIEERIKNHNKFKYYTYKGVPDVRIIVFNQIPIMSYIRIPTKDSSGKANLALGAIGAAIDIANGTTTSAIIGKSTPIEFVPGTKLRISGLKIPFWDRILEYAIKAQVATNLGYAAIDFLIDRELGPMIVELNARPGLSIQISNRDGLRWRLRKANGLKVSTVEKGIRLGKSLFGGEIEEGVETLTGKDVIGIYEKVTLFSKSDKEIPSKAKIDTGADSTSIDYSLAEELGYKDVIILAKQFPQEVASRDEGKILEAKFKELHVNANNPDIVDVQLVKSSHGLSIRPYVKIKIKIQDTVFETEASIFDRSKLAYPVIVGRKSLSKFLVDPTKK